MLERLTKTVAERTQAMKSGVTPPIAKPVANSSTNAPQPGTRPSDPPTEVIKTEGDRLIFTFAKDEENKILDSSGMGNHGTSVGTVPAKGKTGEPARRFDGKSMISMARTSSLNLATLPWTTEIVFKPESPNGQIMIVGGPINGYMLRLNDGKLVFSATFNRKTETITTSKPITDWCKVTAILAADKKMVLYIDGKKVGEQEIPSLIPGEPIFGFRIGKETGGLVGVISSIKLSCGEMYPK